MSPYGYGGGGNGTGFSYGPGYHGSPYGYRSTVWGGPFGCNSTFAGYGFGNQAFGSSFLSVSGDGGFDSGTAYIGSPGIYYSGFDLDSYRMPFGPYGSGMYGRQSGSRYSYINRPAVNYSPSSYSPLNEASRLSEITSARDIEVGLRRLKSGDYRGAVDSFRAAVIEQPQDGSAKAHFALGLVIVGDGKNADRSLRAAAELGSFGKIAVNSMFKDEKERDRIVGSLGRISGEGALAAAWVQSLAGEPGRLRQLAERDPVAKKLLEP